jgi:hypothetical protein
MFNIGEKYNKYICVERTHACILGFVLSKICDEEKLVCIYYYNYIAVLESKRMCTYIVTETKKNSRASCRKVARIA